MLRKFNISIDGKKYLVEMEEVGGTPQYAAPQAPPVAAAAKAPASVAVQPSPEPQAKAPVTGVPVNTATATVSPMPGTILKILVKVGDEVKVNQPLMILEAMKMENEIVSDKNGKVEAVHVDLGQTVNAGDALITIG